MSRIILVHLSDVHVGSIKNWFYKGLKSGWNGHDPFLCRLLHAALLNLPVILKMLPDEKLFLTVSGDLSCVGLRTDFALAHTFLNLKVLLGGLAQPPVGLQVVPNQLWTVPGNHDHWAGIYSFPPPAHDPTIFPDMFLPTPWYDTLVSNDKKLELDLFGVDSNSGLAGLPTNANPSALGRFSFQELDTVTGLENKLADSQGKEAQLKKNGIHLVRAVICHHSFSNKGQWQASASLWARVKAAGKRACQQLRAYLISQCPDPLEPQSVTNLLNLTWQYEVKVVLTGHTHYFWDEKHISPVNSSRTTWELRSSTTLQGPARDAVQGFFVHEIYLSGNPPVPKWRYLEYRYSLAKLKFEPRRDQQGNLNWANAD